MNQLCHRAPSARLLLMVALRVKITALSGAAGIGTAQMAGTIDASDAPPVLSPRVSLAGLLYCLLKSHTRYAAAKSHNVRAFSNCL